MSYFHYQSTFPSLQFCSTGLVLKLNWNSIVGNLKTMGIIYSSVFGHLKSKCSDSIVTYYNHNNYCGHSFHPVLLLMHRNGVCRSWFLLHLSKLYVPGWLMDLFIFYQTDRNTQRHIRSTFLNSWHIRQKNQWLCLNLESAFLEHLRSLKASRAPSRLVTRSIDTWNRSYFEYISSSDEWGQYFSQYNDVSDLKLWTCKHSHSNWDTANALRPPAVTLLLPCACSE